MSIRLRKSTANLRDDLIERSNNERRRYESQRHAKQHARYPGGGGSLLKVARTYDDEGYGGPGAVVFPIEFGTLEGTEFIPSDPQKTNSVYNPKRFFIPAGYILLVQRVKRLYYVVDVLTATKISAEADSLQIETPSQFSTVNIQPRNGLQLPTIPNDTTVMNILNVFGWERAINRALIHADMNMNGEYEAYQMVCPPEEEPAP